VDGAGGLVRFGVGSSGFRRGSFGCSLRTLGRWPGVGRWQPARLANLAALAAPVESLRGPDATLQGPGGRSEGPCMRPGLTTIPHAEWRAWVDRGVKPPSPVAAALALWPEGTGTEGLVLCAISARSQVRGQKPTTRVECGTTRVVTNKAKGGGRYTAPAKPQWREEAWPEVPSRPAPARTRPVSSPDVAPSRDYRRRGEALEALANQRRHRESIEVGVRRSVGKAREAGATWAEIGRALGVTQQAASKRYGRA
jgi:hypothetical protein